MNPAIQPTRVERARAEIERLRGYTSPARGMLAALAATLDRHRPESWTYRADTCSVCREPGDALQDWPCPDVAAVLDLFAPNTPTPPSAV